MADQPVWGSKDRPLFSACDQAILDAFLEFPGVTTPDGTQGIWCLNGMFYRWLNDRRYGIGRWVQVEDEDVKKLIRDFMKGAWFFTGKHHPDTGEALKESLYGKITAARVEALLKGLRTETALTKLHGAAGWLGGKKETDPRTTIAFADVLFDASTTATVKRDSRYFDTMVLPVKWDPGADCPLWLKCLDEWGCGDPAFATFLQREFGYGLLPHNDYRAWFPHYGEQQGGKGTIERVRKALMGAGAMAIHVENLIDDHGKAMLLRQPRVLVLDEMAELGKRQAEAFAQSLKMIVGQSGMSVNPKYKDPIPDFVSRSKVVCLSNVLLQFADKKGSVSGKMKLLPFNRSFAKGADPTLVDKLLEELPGIAMWAAAGAAEVEAERDPSQRFVEPAGAEDSRKMIVDLANPADAFLNWCFKPVDPHLPGHKGVDRTFVRGLYERWYEKYGGPVYHFERVGDWHFKRWLSESSTWELRFVKDPKNRVLHVRGLALRKEKADLEEMVS